MSRRTLLSVKLCRLARSAILIPVVMRSMASSIHCSTRLWRLSLCTISRRILASFFSALIITGSRTGVLKNPPHGLLGLVVGTEFSEMSVRKVRLTLPSWEFSLSRGRAVNRRGVLERFVIDQLTNVSNTPWQSCPRKIL